MFRAPRYYYSFVFALISCSGHIQAKRISGEPVKEVVTKGGRTYTLRCTISEELPIIIKRTCSGATDYFVIRRATEKDTKAFLVGTSSTNEQLKKYMPLVCKNFGTDFATTSKSIAIDNNDFLPSRFYLSVFYKPSADAAEILIGQVGCHSGRAFSEKSVELMYWRLDTVDPRTYGFFKPIIKMFIWYVFLSFDVDFLVMACKKDNKASNKVAMYLGARRTTQKHRKWVYEGVPEDYNIWVLTKQKFFEGYE